MYEDFANLGEQDILISIFPGDNSDEDNLEFSWTVTDFTSRGMLIQLHFDNPEDISRIDVCIFPNPLRAWTSWSWCS